MAVRACVDASVAARWLVPEAGRDKALALLDAWRGTHEIWAPDLIWVEVANAVRHKVLADVMTRAEAESAIGAFLGVSLRIVPCHDVARQSLQLALDVGLTVWDATCLAVAMSVEADLWTADRELFKKGRRVHEQVHLLE